MDWTILLPTSLSMLALGTGYFARTQMQRIDTLEQQMPTKMTEAETRQILEDKINPIKEDMNEIKNKVDKVIDLLIKKG